MNSYYVTGPDAEELAMACWRQWQTVIKGQNGWWIRDDGLGIATFGYDVKLEKLEANVTGPWWTLEEWIGWYIGKYGLEVA